MINHINELFEINGVTDVLINGPSDIAIDRGRGMEKVQMPSYMLVSAHEVKSLAQKYAFEAGERLDEASPIVDGKLPNGVRLAAVISPICPKEKGALISFRIPSRTSLTLDQLVKKGLLTNELKNRFIKAIRQKENIIISGATGSGKTTLLSALVKYIDKSERIICIEEAREISEELHDQMVFLTAKKANLDGKGEIGLTNLLKASLRMRPDRIIIGECRGEETKQYLQILNTGHNGTIATIHANGVNDIENRLSLLSGIKDITEHTKGITLRIHIEKDKGGVRKVVEIYDQKSQ